MLIGFLFRFLLNYQGLARVQLLGGTPCFVTELSQHQVKRITEFEEKRERLLQQLPCDTQLIIENRQHEAASTPGELAFCCDFSVNNLYEELLRPS